ncbi:MAG TPA: aminotransferase class IV [Bacteroidales bacterium]|nr:aminotransferase class IV [Bacteroidales bacterium]
MSLLLESIQVTQKELVNVAYHNARLNASRAAIFGIFANWDLSSILKIPAHLTDATYKCRIEYGLDIYSVEFIPYQQRAVNRLYLIEANDISYPYKYIDRKALDGLRSKIEEFQNSDILIVKHGVITDTSYSNIVFFDGKSWITPDSPLLPGTKRRFYLDHQIICEKRIKPADLKGFSHARLINALIDLNNSPDIPVENIVSFF